MGDVVKTENKVPVVKRVPARVLVPKVQGGLHVVFLV